MNIMGQFADPDRIAIEEPKKVSFYPCQLLVLFSTECAKVFVSVARNTRDLSSQELSLAQIFLIVI